MHNPISIIFSKKIFIVTNRADFYFKFYFNTLFIILNINMLRFFCFCINKNNQQIFIIIVFKNL
jgi:hypothetical protein